MNSKLNEEDFNMICTDIMSFDNLIELKDGLSIKFTIENNKLVYKLYEKHQDIDYQEKYKDFYGIPSVYILKLEGDRYYVGYTENLPARLNSHFNNDGSIYTKKFKPISVVKIIKDANMDMETQATLEMLKLYGRDNVRGGPWTSVETNRFFPTNKRIKDTVIVLCDGI